MQKTDLETISHPIKGFMQERFPALQSVDLDTTTSLLESNAVDSLGLLDVVTYLEETFDIVFDEDELIPENFDSIHRLTKLVLAKRTES